MGPRRTPAAFWIFAIAVVVVSRPVSGGKVILMQNFQPEKVQGQWYLQRINKIILDDVHAVLECIEFTLKHDPAIDPEDVYAMSSHWYNLKREYQETHFNVVDDRSEKARYFFQSHKDKVAVSVLGTDYDNYMVAYGVNMGKDSYYVASRQKVFPESYAKVVDELLTKNDVQLEWLNVKNDGDCPEGH